MKIGLRAGHSKNCRGASGLRDEWESMNVLYSYVADMLEANGHTVINCNSAASTQNGELSEGANKANSEDLDLFISLHMNSFNGQACGVEAWTFGETSRANPVAKRLCDNYAKLGFYNRGVKYNSNYYEMRHIDAPNVIFETCFCDSAKDIAIWSSIPWETLALNICNAIEPNISLDGNAPAKEDKERYQVRIYAFSKEEAEEASKVISEEHSWYNVIEKI